MDEPKKDLNAEDYNPFEHRIVKKPNSDLRSLANLVKASLGSGLLAIPLAFANAGWGVGLVGTVVVAFICGHCVHIFVTASRKCCKAIRKPLLGYAETCEVVFETGPKFIRRFASSARIFAEFSLLCTYIGVCCIFTVLIAESVKQLVDRYVSTTIWPVEYYCLIFIIPLCIMCQIRYLKWLAPFSIVANVLLIATFCICMYYVFNDKITVADKKVVGNPARFPAFLSTVIFAMEGIGVVMPVENTMKKPEHFLGCPSVMVIAMTLIMLLYSMLGLFGYFRYGDALQGTITLNLPLDDWPAVTAKCFISLSIFLTYPLHFYVVIDILMKYLEPRVKDKYKSMLQTLVRIAVVCFGGAIGVALPFLEQIINIVGALFYSILGLIIPGVIDIVLHWENFGKYKWVLWKDILIIAFGTLSLVSGCAVTISDIVDILNRKTE